MKQKQRYAQFNGSGEGIDIILPSPSPPTTLNSSSNGQQNQKQSTALAAKTIALAPPALANTPISISRRKTPAADERPLTAADDSGSFIKIRQSYSIYIYITVEKCPDLVSF